MTVQKLTYIGIRKRLYFEAEIIRRSTECELFVSQKQPNFPVVFFMYKEDGITSEDQNLKYLYRKL